jgi:hypothetical protein
MFFLFWKVAISGLAFNVSTVQKNPTNLFKSDYQKCMDLHQVPVLIKQNVGKRHTNPFETDLADLDAKHSNKIKTYGLLRVPPTISPYKGRAPYKIHPKLTYNKC